MKTCRDATPFEWIEIGRLPLRSPYQESYGNTIANLLPHSFEAYVKILHRIDGRVAHTSNSPMYRVPHSCGFIA
jgi:hypothetical protein